MKTEKVGEGVELPALDVTAQDCKDAHDRYPFGSLERHEHASLRRKS
jgi:hypothetical protein